MALLIPRSSRRLYPALLAAGLLLIAAATTAAGAAAAKGADAIVDRVLATYGGKAALDKVKAYRMEGSVNSVMRGTGALARTFVRPGRLRIALDYPNHPETRILDAGQGWRSDGKGNIAPADGFLLTSMVLQAARADLP